MGYGDVIQRMNELRSLTAASMVPGATPSGPATTNPALAAQFQQQLAASVLSSEDTSSADASSTGGFDLSAMLQSTVSDAASTTDATASNPYASLQAGGLSTQAQLLQQLQQLGLSNVAGLSATQGTAATTATAPLPFVTGKTEGVDPVLLQRLNAMGQELGKPIDIISGNRTYAEQAELYQKYLNGTGNLAAPPGSSNHEHGGAVDAYVDGVALGSVMGARESAARNGLGFPVGGEAWHVERTDS